MDKEDISRLENKIKALETDIVVAKKHGEERRLDKLEQSLTNTSFPVLNDHSLLDVQNQDESDESCEDNGNEALQHNDLLSKLLASSSDKKPTATKVLDDSVLQQDELAILGDCASSDNSAATEGNNNAAAPVVAVNDVIDQYDEYEKQLMREISGMEVSLKKDSMELQNNDFYNQYQSAEYPAVTTDQPANLSEAVQALFDFLDQEIEIESQAKRVTLEAF